MEEREVVLAWRNLFRSKEISAETFAKAETLLEELNGESPLRFRLAVELAELKQGPTARKKKPVARRKTT